MQSLGVPVDGGRIYEVAVTHRSYAFEQPEPVEHNERLEFLGDAVLDVIVAELIYRDYPHLPEGDMARLRSSVVNTSALAELARELDVGAHLHLGKGEEATGGRDKISLLADTFEALVGAVFIDRGIEATRAVLAPIFTKRLRASAAARMRYDAKTALQEVCVREHSGLPSYRLSASGPDHDKRFAAHVYVGEELYGTGTGRSKKEAEQRAAQVALERLSVADVDATAAGRDSRARAS